MVSNNFESVRAAFCANVAENLRRLRVEIKAEAKGDWIQVACMLCTDTSGSASISAKSGFLRCHQCGAKADLFTWCAKILAKSSPWDACQAVAQLVGVQVKGVERTKQMWKVCPAISEETMADLHQRLFEGTDDEMAREFLRRRFVWSPPALEALPIGSHNGKLVFFQHDVNGRLMNRGKVYNPFPLNDEPKWTWSKNDKTGGGGSSKTVSFWPHLDRYVNAPLDWPIILCEGEHDVMALLIRCDYIDRPAIVVTWTGGGGAPIPADSIPKWMRDREVRIIYDNDVFQGLGTEDLAPDAKKLAELRVRKRNLVDQIGPSFQANRCQVFIHAISIPPLTKWGADLRDEIDAGLEDIDKLPRWKLKDVREEMLQPKEVDFVDVHKHLGQFIEFRCQVAGVSDEVQLRPIRHHIDCPQGQLKFCTSCKVPNLAPNGVLEWANSQPSLAAAMTSPQLPRFVMDNVCAKPSNCKAWTLTPLETHAGARWTAMPCEGDEREGARPVEIISNENPPLSGELRVRGWLYISYDGVRPVLMAERIEASDRVQIPIAPHAVSMLGQCPSKAEAVEEIDAYLDRWEADVSNHTTHIYGRRDIHVTLGLSMHSALWFHMGGQQRRGWIDACMIGATRTGKSAATRAYLRALQMGQHFTPMGNFSRAGLTLGTLNINGEMKMRPGVFPRNHGKLLAIDEAHLMLLEDARSGGLFPMLQGARDIGKVEAAKITGSQMLPAAVRLVTIANWIGGGRSSFSAPAQHLLALYGTPESLARMDFGIPVDEIESGAAPRETPNFWTVERQRAVAMRAWNMTPDLIRIDEEAIEEAFRLCRIEWKDRYSEDLPLFTEKEKVFSVIRIAIAIANMTLSHWDANLDFCHVRLVHVKWAAKWLEHTWHLLEYDVVSRTTRQIISPANSWRIEALLTARLHLRDAASVQFVLGRLFGVMTRDELRAVLGFDFQNFELWCNDMLRCGGLEVIRTAGSWTGLGFRLSRGAVSILQKLIAFAAAEPEGWERRFNKIESWSMTARGNRAIPLPQGLAPIDAPLELFDDRYDAAKNRDQGQGHAG